MTAAAEEAVRDLLKAYGRSICDTPRMFEMLLRQQNKATPEETAVLVAAVRHHVGKRLLSGEPKDVETLTKALTAEGHDPAIVTWAVETWANGLAGTQPEKKITAWNAVGTPAQVGRASAAVARKAIAGLFAVALAGMVGGTAPALWLGERLLRKDQEVLKFFEAAGIKEKDIKDPFQFMLVYGSLGGLAGLVGAGTGFMLGGHTRMSPGRVLGGVIGAFQAGVNGAYYGLAHGEGAGTFIGCLVLTGFGTYIATLVGVFVVLFFISQLAFLVFKL
jgi:hypothetical protein